MHGKAVYGRRLCLLRLSGRALGFGLITYFLRLSMVPLTALLAIGGQAAAQPRVCGDQSTDNRPNGCSILRDGTWSYQLSKCRRISENVFEYTHCSGTTQLMRGTDWICSVGACGGGYVARSAHSR